MTTFKGVNLRLSYPYVTDVDGFSKHVTRRPGRHMPDNVRGQHGYGWDSTTGMNYRNRSITVDTRLAGMHFYQHKRALFPAGPAKRGWYLPRVAGVL